MAERVTIMKLKVDDLSRNSRKVEQLLSKYREIQDKRFDEQANIVTIWVKCRSAVEFRDKLRSKGRGSIKSIEIVQLPAPKAADAPPPPPPKPPVPEKEVTIMKLKVDLECPKCYKKVKKLLCKYPQIRDEKFDEKANIVTITVVCCSPEKIRDKLCCKGGGSIKSIEIVEPPKPKLPEPEKKKEAEPEKKKEADKPKGEAPKKEAEKPKAEPEKKKEDDKPKAEPKKKKEADKPKGEAAPPKKEDEKPKDKPAPASIPIQPQAPPPMAVPVGMCIPYCEGRPVGPYNPYGGPVVCYDGYYGRPVYDSYGGGRPYYVSRCDQYFSEENATGCAIM